MNRSPSSLRAMSSGRQRPGVRFAPGPERAMEATARWVATQLPGNESGLLALREFHAPFGVPDLTVVVGDPSVRRRRLRLGVPPLLNEVDAGVVAAVGSEWPASARQIAVRLSWPLSTVQRRLPTVLKSGALIEVSPGRFLRRPAIVPVGFTWAIETKVDDWRKALVQCRTYRTWADGYVLVMERVSAPGVRELRRSVSADRGGLVIGGEWITKPSTSALKRPRRLWTSEHIVAACRKPRSSPLPARTR